MTPFVLLHGDDVVAIGREPTFGAVGPDERVEFHPDGSMWDEVDRLKNTVRDAERRAKRVRVAASRKERHREAGFRLVFAVSGKYRFSANRHARRVTVGLRGDHAGVSIDSRRIESLQEEASKYESLWWGVSVLELLVALDAWLEAGCPRRKWKVLR